MASFYNLLKYAATGIASPDMTYYDRMRASTLMGGATVQTLTGQPPLSFKADGTPLISWSMKGNGSQQGAPTPDNPIQPEFVGVKTANLFDATTAVSGYYVSDDDGQLKAASNNNASDFIPITPNTIYYITPLNAGNWGAWYDENKVFISGMNGYRGRSSPNGAKFVRLTVNRNDNNPDFAKNFMISVGSTALPYEPYGYKIPITCGGETVPVYLPEPLRKIGDYADVVSSDGTVTRRIAETIIDWNNLAGFEQTADYSMVKMRITDLKTAAIESLFISSHFQRAGYPRPADLIGYIINSYNAYYNIQFYMSTDISDLAAAKAWFEAESLAGRPVTIWNALATSVSEAVAVPQIPTIKGQNTLTVDTDLQPSEMTITYKG